MNLLGKKTCLLLVITGLFLVSCEDPGQIGIDGKLPNQLDVSYVELPLDATMAHIDSIGTSGSTSVLFGQYQDPNFGTIQATAYAGFSNYDLNLIVSPDAIYDSCLLYLDVNYGIGTDFSTAMDIEVQRLGDTLDRQKIYYTKDDLFSFRSIGQGLYFYDPNTMDSVRIRLNDDFGEKFFGAIKDTTVTIFNNQEEFRLFFRGVKIFVTNASQTILGFDPGSQTGSLMSFYYHTVDSTGNAVNYTYNFPMISEQNWTEIKSDYTGTVFANLSPPYEDFDPGDGKLYSNAALGLVPKLDLQSLLNFRDTVGNVVINRADLEFDLDGNIDTLSIQDQLIFYVTDSTNRFKISDVDKFPRTILNEATTAIYTPTAGSSPHSIIFDSGNNRYTDQVTIYVQNLMNNKIDDKYLLIFPNRPVLDFYGTYHEKISDLNHFIMDKSKIKLRLYYSKLN